jgi:hypothetical protein
MTESTIALPERTTYGNWITQRSPGLFGAGAIGTGVLIGGILFSLLALLLGGLVPALVVAGVSVLAFTAVGTPLGRTVARRVLYARHQLAGGHSTRTGVVAHKTRRQRTRLPGLVEKTELLTGTHLGVDFVVVKSAGGLYSIVVRCAPDGPAMQDQAQVDAWVAGYAGVLSMCGQETGLVCAKAITDTAPDPGGQLEAMVQAFRVDGSPTLAREVMDQCVASLPATSSENLTYLELTYRGRLLNRRGDEKAILAELARKVPGLLTMLAAAGGGSVEMVAPTELARIVRVAYDPVTATALEQAELAGDTQVVEWADAGPVACRDLWGELVHDSARSITWEMHGAPRSKITERALAPLLAPHSHFARKRVALIYRPHTPDESTTVAERDASTANFVAQQGKKRPSASARLVQAAAEQSRHEVAAGAASVRFSLLVTGTVLFDGDLDQAVSTLESRGRQVPVRLRRCYGAQAAAFCATLPVGFVPHLHTVVPASVREWA